MRNTTHDSSCITYSSLLQGNPQQHSNAENENSGSLLWKSLICHPQSNWTSSCESTPPAETILNAVTPFNLSKHEYRWTYEPIATIRQGARLVCLVDKLHWEMYHLSNTELI